MQYREKEVEFLGMCPSGEDDILKHIESCVRRCYKSEHKIDWENRSYEAFFKMLSGNGHMSGIEHSNIVVEITCEGENEYNTLFTSFALSALYQMSYFRLMPMEDEHKLIIAGNVRAWLEFFEKKYWFALYFDLGDFLASEYPIIFEKIYTYMEANRDERASIPNVENDRVAVGTVQLRIVSDQEQMQNYELFDAYDIPVYTFVAYTDRGITHEIVRHRVLSYSQESTRYVRYGNIELIPFNFPPELVEKYESVMAQVEELYGEMLSRKVVPGLARNVLPNSLKTEIAMSGRMSGWKHFIELRDSKAAHPDIRFVAGQIKNYLGLGEEEEAA